jgi:predicted dienelactone hydrolase
MKPLSLLVALACFALAPSASALGQAGVPAAPAVPVQQAAVEDPGHAPIRVAIWSPVSGTGLPLVVISHGTGGGPISHIDTAQALAKAGYVVVAPMHRGDNFQDDGAVGTPEWLAGRSRDVSKTIDFMFARWNGRARLRPGRVGLFGMSAGGTTALIAAGGVPDLRTVTKQCAAQPEFVCRIMKPQTPPGAAAPAWTADSRIGAAVVAAPGLGFAFAPDGLKAVHVPVQLWVGSDDETVPYETNGAVVRRQLGGKVEFHRVEGAVHLSFLAPCTAETPPPLCQDKPGFDRAAFHGAFNKAVVDFFDSHLRPRTDPR